MTLSNSHRLLILVAVLQVSGLNPCIESPCSCCISGTCEDPAIYPYPCRGCIDGRTGPSCLEPCPETCVNCSQLYFKYESKEICYQCKSGYYSGRYKDVPSYPILQDCSLSCNDGCESCTSFYNCTLCKTGYLMDSRKTCRKCPDNCVQCTSEDACNQCADGFVWDGQNCRQCMPSCKRCNINEDCTECYSEYYMSGPECRRCQSGCLSCKDENLCSECKTGYYINNNNCFPCSYNCISCAHKFYYTCNECAKGYYKSNGKCFKCPPGCTSCQTDTSCQTCDQHYKLHNRMCYLCPPSCTECSTDNVCISCTEKFYNENGECQQCPKRCLTCANTQKCLSCMNKFYGTLCSSPCRENCKNNVCNIDTGICVTCSAGYYKDENNNCKQCPDHCTVCSSSASCLECQAGYMGLQCEKACPKCKPGTSCDKSSGYCLEECRDGFSGKVCDMPCKAKCLSCDRDNPSKCQLCASNRYGAACLQVCSSNCSNNTCNDNDGSCTFECNPGSWGPRCEHDCADNCSENACFRNNGTCKQLCSKGSYGKGCQSSCSLRCSEKICHYTTGECLKGCLQGFKGQFCEKDAQNGEVIAAILIIPVIAIIAIVVIIIFCVQRRQRMPCITRDVETDLEEHSSTQTDVEQRLLDDVGSVEEKTRISSSADSEDNPLISEEGSGAESADNSAGTPIPPPRVLKKKRKSMAQDLEDSNQNSISDTTKSEKNAPGNLHETMPSSKMSSQSQPEQSLANSLHISLQLKKEPAMTAHHEQRSSATIQHKQETKSTVQHVQESVMKTPTEQKTLRMVQHEQKSLLQPHQVTFAKVPCKHGQSTIVQFTKAASVAAQPEQDKAMAGQPQPEASTTVQPEQHTAVPVETKKEIFMEAQSKKERFIALHPEQDVSSTVHPEEHTSAPVESKKETSVAAEAKQDKSAGIHQRQETSSTVQTEQNTSASVEAKQQTSVAAQAEEEKSVVMKHAQETCSTEQHEQEEPSTLQYVQEISSTIQSEQATSLTEQHEQETSLTLQQEQEKSFTLQPGQEPSSTIQSKQKSSASLQHEQKKLSEVISRSESQPTTTSLNGSYKEGVTAVKQSSDDDSTSNANEDETPEGNKRDSAILSHYAEEESTERKHVENKEMSETNHNSSVSKHTAATELNQLEEVFRGRDISAEFKELQAMRVEDSAALNRVKDAPCCLNARYIDVYHKERRYIISLEPQFNNAEDVAQFWKMVWKEDCIKIIMLSNQPKETMSTRHQYWPQEGKEDTYGSITVECWKEFNISCFYRPLYLRSIKQDTEVKTVHHFEYDKWLDEGLPQELSDLFRLYNTFKTYPDEREGPILVHCRNDIGNTGVFIAFDILKNEDNNAGHVDIYGCVKRLQEQCPTMFQTEEQYRALYRAFSIKDESVLDSSTSSVGR